jgi:hypothetical protein
MMIAYAVLHWVYMAIYAWIAVFFTWQVFKQKNLGRAIGSAMVAVPFVIRMFGLH